MVGPVVVGIGRPRRLLVAVTIATIVVPRGDVAKAQPSLVPVPGPGPGIGEPAFGATLTRDSLVAEVLLRNPEITAAAGSWRAALARVLQAAGLEDPMASYSVAPLSIGSSDATFGQELRLSQRLPFPGKRGVRRQVAEAEAAASERSLAEVRLRLATTVAVLYDELWLLDRRREVAQEHVRLLANLQEVATARYAAGLAPQQAPLQAEVEAARIERQILEIDGERLRVTAQLNALLHRAPEAPLPPPAEQMDLPEIAAEPALTDTLAHPQLQARQAEVEARRAGLELARRAYQPDLELMTSYSTMWDMEEHRWMVGAGINLPIWRQRRQAAESEAEAQLAASEAGVAAFEDHVRQEIASAAASVDETAALLRLYRDRVLPPARDQLAAARASFQSGAADMFGVIEAERSLRAAQVDYYATLAAHASRRTELQSALGRLGVSLPPSHTEHSAPPASPRPEVKP